MLPVVEKFVSINGEGPCAGELAVFIRFKGCNLNCSYCDTKWANEQDAPYENMSVADILDYVTQTGIYNVTLTGGEPLLHDECKELIDVLIKNKHRVEIETNGSISLKKFAELECVPAFTMDYKLQSSGMEKFMDMDNFSLLKKQDTVKFVSGSIEDLKKAKEIIEKYNLINRCHVYISPVFGAIEPADIVEFMKDNKLNGVRIQLQLHKFIWDSTRRGV